MNCLIQKIGFASLLLLSHVACWGQYFELRAGSGATLVGNTFQVTAGSNFNVEVWMAGDCSASRTSIAKVIGVAISLAFDRTNGSSTNAVKLDNKLNVLSYTATVPSLPRVFNSNTLRAAATTTGVGNNYSFAGGAVRPYVSYSFFAADPGVAWDPAPRNNNHVATLTLSASALSHGEIYGDDTNEAGLFVANQGGFGGPMNGASGYVGWLSRDSCRFGSTKYAVQANPEPATWLTLGLGLAAASKWRRRK